MTMCKKHKQFHLPCVVCKENGEGAPYRGMQTPQARVGSWRGRSSHPHYHAQLDHERGEVADDAS